MDVARLFGLAGDARPDSHVVPGSPRPRAIQWRGRTLHVSVARGARARDRDQKADLRVGRQNAAITLRSNAELAELAEHLVFKEKTQRARRAQRSNVAEVRRSRLES